MSSQDTIHPCDNRVLSIRELMALMTIPDIFRWTDHDADLTVENSDTYLRENEGNIRRCIGEAVPTHIGYTIAKKIKEMLDYEDMMNGSDAGDKPDNFYIQSHDLRGFVMNPQWVFDHITSLSSEYEAMSVEVDSISSFVVYIPMLVSYFSHVDKIDIDVISNSKGDEDELRRILGLIDLGDNVHVNLIKAFTDNYYDIRIRHDGCCELSWQKKRNSSNKAEGNQLQLSLF